MVWFLHRSNNKKSVENQQFHCDAQIEQGRAKYDRATGEPPWVRAQLSGQLSIAFCERGQLRDAALYAEIARDHAIDGQRLMHGLASAEGKLALARQASGGVSARTQIMSQ